MISVIMPAYNAGKWIAEAIRNLLNQIFTDFELLVINDGSTDDTLSICERVAEKDPRVRIISQPNGGLCSARNLGLKNAKGEYYIMIDSDDKILPNALQKLHDAAKESNADIVVGGYETVDFGKQTRVTHKLPRVDFAVNGNLNNANILSLLDQRMLAPTWNKLIRREFVDFLFDNTYSINEDLLFSVTAFAKAARVAIIPDVVYEYYIRTTSSLSRKFHSETPGSLDAIWSVLKEHCVGDPDSKYVEFLIDFLCVYLNRIINATDIPTESKMRYIKEACNSKMFQDNSKFKNFKSLRRKVLLVTLKTNTFGLMLCTRKGK